MGTENNNNPDNRDQNGTRGSDGRFLPGNPGGGRPKRAKEIREAFLDYSLEALGVLVHEMRHGDTSAARISAAKEILARGPGTYPSELKDSSGDGLVIRALKLVAGKPVAETLKEEGGCSSNSSTEKPSQP